MTLSALIKKGGLAMVATATPATPATLKLVGGGTVATVATVAVAKTPEPPVSTMTAEEETAIRAWLAHIDETDPAITAEVMDKCRTDAGARTYFLLRAEEVPRPIQLQHWVTCGNCRHYERIESPHLGHCAHGEPESITGLWDTDRRWCENHVPRIDIPGRGQV